MKVVKVKSSFFHVHWHEHQNETLSVPLIKCYIYTYNIKEYSLDILFYIKISQLMIYSNVLAEGCY